MAMDKDEVVDLRRTQLMAIAASLVDVRRALLRAARIPSPFASELRNLLETVADLDRRVIQGVGGSMTPK